MEIDESFEHPENAVRYAPISIRARFDPDSGLTAEKLEHSLKQFDRSWDGNHQK
jgi:hypothetical protein